MHWPARSVCSIWRSSAFISATLRRRPAWIALFVAGSFVGTTALALRLPLPISETLVTVSPLLRELILEATRLPRDYDERGRDGRIMRLVLDELAASPAMPLHLPQPQDRRLKRICAALMEHPGRTDSLEDWAARVGSSARTLARTFTRETGMGFATWRQQARLAAALQRLAAGAPVTAVALDLGYASPSAFTAMFRRALGTRPSDYFR